MKKPKPGELYYTPEIFGGEFCIRSQEWTGSAIDERTFRMGCCFPHTPDGRKSLTNALKGAKILFKDAQKYHQCTRLNPTSKS